MTGGKSKWFFSYPSYISTKVLEWKKDPTLLEALYESSANNKGSYLMKWLLGKEEERLDSNVIRDQRLNNFDIGVFTTLQEVAGESTSSSELSKNDYFIDHLNKVLSNGYVRTITPADKTTDIQIRTGLFVDAFESFEDGQVVLKENVQDIMLNYFNVTYEP